MAPPMKIDPVELDRMWREGALLREMAEAFGVSVPAVSKVGAALGHSRKHGTKRKATAGACEKSGERRSTPPQR